MLPVVALTGMGILTLFAGAAFAPLILKQYGVDLTPEDAVRGVSPERVYVQVPATTPGAAPAPAQSPTFAQTANDAVKNPTSLLFGGVFLFAGALIFSQFRAGFHEVSETTRDVYTEGSRVTRAASGADGGPRNYSRRARN